MYCPQCRVEYRDGFSECSDCHVPLLSGTPQPEAAEPFDPSLDLVVVFESSNSIQSAMAQGLLEDSGIPFFALGQLATLVRDVDGFLHKTIRLQVPAGRAAEARELLQLLEQPDSTSLDSEP
ncbi:MAG TPA: DUF2007 domain-containing protein [Bryobacteraceae bacterium]|nr:DUF2007 domain-containing protein [Bryobacteraceae bacterium]